MVVYQGVGHPDLRVLHVNVGLTLISLHYFLRLDETGHQMLFLLREVDLKLLRRSNISLLGNNGQTEQSIRVALSSLCDNQYTWARSDELKALKCVGLLTKRAPRAALLPETLVLRLLRFFACDLYAIIFEAIFISINQEMKLLRNMLLHLNAAVRQATRRFGLLDLFDRNPSSIDHSPDHNINPTMPPLLPFPPIRIVEASEKEHKKKWKKRETEKLAESAIIDGPRGSSIIPGIPNPLRDYARRVLSLTAGTNYPPRWLEKECHDAQFEENTPLVDFRHVGRLADIISQPATGTSYWKSYSLDLDNLVYADYLMHVPPLVERHTKQEAAATALAAADPAAPPVSYTSSVIVPAIVHHPVMSTLDPAELETPFATNLYPHHKPGTDPGDETLSAANESLSSMYDPQNNKSISNSFNASKPPPGFRPRPQHFVSKFQIPVYNIPPLSEIALPTRDAFVNDNNPNVILPPNYPPQPDGPSDPKHNLVAAYYPFSVRTTDGDTCNIKLLVAQNINISSPSPADGQQHDVDKSTTINTQGTQISNKTVSQLCNFDKTFITVQHFVNGVPAVPIPHKQNKRANKKDHNTNSLPLSSPTNGPPLNINNTEVIHFLFQQVDQKSFFTQDSSDLKQDLYSHTLFNPKSKYLQLLNHFGFEKQCITSVFPSITAPSHGSTLPFGSHSHQSSTTSSSPIPAFMGQLFEFKPTSTALIPMFMIPRSSNLLRISILFQGYPRFILNTQPFDPQILMKNQQKQKDECRASLAIASKGTINARRMQRNTGVSPIINHYPQKSQPASMSPTKNDKDPNYEESVFSASQPGDDGEMESTTLEAQWAQVIANALLSLSKMPAYHEIGPVSKMIFCDSCRVNCCVTDKAVNRHNVKKQYQADLARLADPTTPTLPRCDELLNKIDSLFKQPLNSDNTSDNQASHNTFMVCADETNLLTHTAPEQFSQPTKYAEPLMCPLGIATFYSESNLPSRLPPLPQIQALSDQVMAATRRPQPPQPTHEIKTSSLNMAQSAVASSINHSDYTNIGGSNEKTLDQPGNRKFDVSILTPVPEARQPSHTVSIDSSCSCQCHLLLHRPEFVGGPVFSTESPSQALATTCGTLPFNMLLHLAIIHVLFRCKVSGLTVMENDEVDFSMLYNNFNCQPSSPYPFPVSDPTPIESRKGSRGRRAKDLHTNTQDSEYPRRLELPNFNGLALSQSNIADAPPLHPLQILITAMTFLLTALTSPVVYTNSVISFSADMLKQIYPVTGPDLIVQLDHELDPDEQECAYFKFYEGYDHGLHFSMQYWDELIDCDEKMTQYPATDTPTTILNQKPENVLNNIPNPVSTLPSKANISPEEEHEQFLSSVHSFLKYPHSRSQDITLPPPFTPRYLTNTRWGGMTHNSNLGGSYLFAKHNSGIPHSTEYTNTPTGHIFKIIKPLWTGTSTNDHSHTVMDLPSCAPFKHTHFPWYITPKTLPLWYALQHYLTKLQDPQLIVLFRHAGLVSSLGATESESSPPTPEQLNAVEVLAQQAHSTTMADALAAGHSDPDALAMGQKAANDVRNVHFSNLPHHNYLVCTSNPATQSFNTLGKNQSEAVEAATLLSTLDATTPAVKNAQVVASYIANNPTGLNDANQRISRSIERARFDAQNSANTTTSTRSRQVEAKPRAKAAIKRKAKDSISGGAIQCVNGVQYQQLPTKPLTTTSVPVHPLPQHDQSPQLAFPTTFPLLQNHSIQPNHVHQHDQQTHFAAVSFHQPLQRQLNVPHSLNIAPAQLYQQSHSSILTQQDQPQPSLLTLQQKFQQLKAPMQQHQQQQQLLSAPTHFQQHRPRNVDHFITGDSDSTNKRLKIAAEPGSVFSNPYVSMASTPQQLANFPVTNGFPRLAPHTTLLHPFLQPQSSNHVTSSSSSSITYNQLGKQSILTSSESASFGLMQHAQQPHVFIPPPTDTPPSHTEHRVTVQPQVHQRPILNQTFSAITNPPLYSHNLSLTKLPTTTNQLSDNTALQQHIASAVGAVVTPANNSNNVNSSESLRNYVMQQYPRQPRPF